MHEMLKKSIFQLREHLCQKEISCLELLNLHIEQIQTWNPHLNAMVQDRFAEAQKQAKLLDSIGDFETNPLAGIPCTIKECFAFEGMPQSSGLYERRHIRSKTNAPVVQNILDAGAIPMGVSNLSELCMWMESNNAVYGRSNNPYDLRCTTGGSSGGEGALVGCGGSTFGLGSDIGGSIRMPAFFNGVYGHKCSSSLIDNTGQYPIASGDAQKYLCTGPISRSAQDLPLLLSVMSGQSIETKTIDWSNTKVYSIPDDGRIRVQTDLQDAQNQLFQWCKQQGATTEEIRIPELQKSIEIWSGALDAAGGPTFEELLWDGNKKSLSLEFVKWGLRTSKHTFPALGLSLVERIAKKLPNQLERFLAMQKELRQKLDDLLDENTILLYPSHGSVAPRHKKSLFVPVRWAYTAILNIMELPVTQIPLGLNEDGLPLGVQLVGGYGNDALTISAAIDIEQKRIGWIPPTLP
jgi:fatty acid amide hydrolase 2